jgi:hypothetical protein
VLTLNRKAIFYIPLVALLLIFCAFLFFMSDDTNIQNVPDNNRLSISAPANNPQIQPQNDEQDPPAINDNSNNNNDFPIFIRDFNGKIAIFREENSPLPEEITNIRTYSLPDADKELILNGISIENHAQLSRLLEDLGS